MPSADEDALRAIRAASTALQEWWPEGESPRSWRGVEWSGDRVQELNLNDSGLEVLAPQIGQLTALTNLYLGGCEQLKELPPQIGQLTALTDLSLARCEQLKELPPQIGQLLALTNLSLSRCEQLKELPPQIGQLTALTDLALARCEQLKELPPQIGQLLALTNLSLSRCEQLKELPPQIGQLTALTHLHLGGCEQLKELPPQIGQLLALTNLSLHGCKLLKELPPQIGQLTALTSLDLYGCKQLKELPPQIGQLIALAYLFLGKCEQLTLAPGAEEGQPAQTIIAAYARLLIVAPRKDAPSELLAFLRANPKAVPAFFKTILTDAAHAVWLGEAVTATPELAELTDASGRRAVDVAHATCRKRMLESSWLCKRYELQPGPPEHRSATSVVIRADDHADKPDYAQIFEDADTDKNGTLELNELDAVTAKLGLSKDLLLNEASATSIDGKARIRLDKEAFVSACKHLLGDGPRKVVIKLMKDKVQWQREMTSRNWEWDAATSKYAVSQSKVPLDAQYVVQALDAPTQAEMATAVSESRILQVLAEKYMEKASITKYAYPVVMDAANRNLAQIYLQERPGPDALRVLARQIFEAVQHMHSRKLMHGDLKTLNLVRSIMDGKLRLIDFDAFGTIFGDDEDGESYACAKFSSGVLPPEALYELNAEERSQFDEYWAGLKDKDPDLWAKVRPKSSKQGKKYVVKTFRTGDSDAKPIKDGLPYELLPASASLDMWSLGVLLYLLFTGENLVPVTRDDDFVSGTGMGAVHNWNHEKRREKLSKINDPAAHDLLSQLLSPNPTTRSEKSLDQLLKEHSFFNPKPGDIEMQKKLKEIQEEVNKVREEQDKQMALLTAIKELSLENKFELLQTRKVLLKGIFEATEVKTPTTFIILDEVLSVEEPELSTEEQDQLFSVNEDGSGIELAGNLKVAKERLNKAKTWLERLKTFGEGVIENNPNKVFGKIKEVFGELMTKETMYFYLVDELTGRPVQGDGYPIEITTPAELVPKLLPVMQVGMRAMSLYNGVAGVAQMVGYPAPKVPEAWRKGAQSSVEMLKQESSVEKFGAVHAKVQEGDNEQETTRGASLRELQRFFEEHDKDKGYAGLRRIADEDGTAVWTLLNETEVAAQLEKRARERREEEQRRDDLLSALARTPSEAANYVVTLQEELEAARAELETARGVAKAAQGDKPSGGCCSVL